MLQQLRLSETFNNKLNKAKDFEKSEIDNSNLQETKAQLRQYRKETSSNTMDLKSKNLVLNGITEKPNESCRQTVTSFIKNILLSFTADKIENMYHLGQASKDGKRSILEKFKDPDVKQEIIKKQNSLKYSKQFRSVYCNENLPEEKEGKTENKINCQICGVSRLQGNKD